MRSFGSFKSRAQKLFGGEKHTPSHFHVISWNATNQLRLSNRFDSHGRRRKGAMRRESRSQTFPSPRHFLSSSPLTSTDSLPLFLPPSLLSSLPKSPSRYVNPSNPPQRSTPPPPFFPNSIPFSSNSRNHNSFLPQENRKVHLSRQSLLSHTFGLHRSGM